jgi:hypothetical protein
MHIHTATMMSLFAGDNSAYGVYRIPKEAIKDGKKLVGKAATLRKPVTVELWDKHLFGKDGLGIIPINKNSEVKWGAIDIDDYDMDPKKLNQKVRQLNLPLVTFRTKSGGTHLYCFLTKFTSAKLMQYKLREFASALGYGTAEIFPKQTELLSERGDIGQWINMPYFDEAQTMRYALHQVTGKALSLEDFIKYANEKVISPEQLAEFKVEYGEDLIGCPPCLDILIKQGFPSGTRNNGLFNLGVYAIKSSPEGWRKKLEEYNNLYMDPPLTSVEVQGVVKSLEKKEYEYTCKTEPIHSFCNIAKCRTCKFGVNTGTGMPAMGTLTKLNTDPPLWFIDITDGGRLELTTDELQQPLKFQKKCMETLNLMPVIMKRDAWQLIVQQLLSGCSVIEVPKDTSQKGTFYDYLEEFCTGRVQAKTHEDILVGKPLTIDDKHWFRLRDLMDYLKKKQLDFSRNRVTMMLRDIDATHKFMNISGRGSNLWGVPAFRKNKNELSIPELEGEGADEAF